MKKLFIAFILIFLSSANAVAEVRKQTYPNGYYIGEFNNQNQKNGYGIFYFNNSQINFFEIKKESRIKILFIFYESLNLK